MRSLTRIAVTGCLALAALSALAVLDVGFPTAEAAPSVSPFAGNWSGTWQVSPGDHGGTFDWTISDAGRISGRVVHAQDGVGGAVVGEVAGGTLSFTGFVPADEHWHVGGYPFSGTAQIEGGSTLVVSVTRRDLKTETLVAILERN